MNSFILLLTLRPAALPRSIPVSSFDATNGFNIPEVAMISGAMPSSVGMPDPLAIWSHTSCLIYMVPSVCDS